MSVAAVQNEQPAAVSNDVARRYLPLVRRIAMRTIRKLPAQISLDEILSAGWLGLTESLQRRRPDMPEVEFEAYASHRVRGAILDYLRNLDPLSRKLRNASRRISRAIADLSARLSRYPNEDEVAGELGVTLAEYHVLLADISSAGLARLELSGDEATDEPNPEGLASKKELVQLVSDAVELLPERLRLIVALYYQESCTLREIGEVLGVTESRVCQLHSEAVHLIRSRIGS
jgi:RNA polymerase sigma factor FliA